VELPANDTWARDHSGISVFRNGKKCICDFTFNGWGLKFASDFDNRITCSLFSKHVFKGDVELDNKKDFVLEGGSIESDGKGTLLTTSECLLSPNRNSYLSKEGIEDYLKEVFGLDRILWVDHGYLAGDDTDSHIDTLARYCNEHTIVYVKCDDKQDEHYDALLEMEKQLKTYSDYKGKPYGLITLPMAKAVYDEDNVRLPATYANFLIMNDIVLMPFYNDKETDEQARVQLQKAFPGKDVVGVDCSPLIRQHGSLHCVTMQYPENFID
jgi:agmatine/peptidylarginine deiminase